MRELLVTLGALMVGFALMPILIFYAGSEALGRYEGASVGAMFRSLYAGLAVGSAAAWVITLGPYALYLLFRLCRAWWRFSAKIA